MMTLKLKRRNTIFLAIVSVISVLILIASCGGGGGGGGGAAGPVAEDAESAGDSSGSGTASNEASAPSVTEVGRYTVNGVTYIIMSNGTVSAQNADGSARTITASASGSTYTIIDGGNTVVIATDNSGTAAITVTDASTGAVQHLYASNGGTATAVTRTVSFVTNGGNTLDPISVPDSNTAALPSANGKDTWSFYIQYGEPRDVKNRGFTANLNKRQAAELPQTKETHQWKV